MLARMDCRRSYFGLFGIAELQFRESGRWEIEEAIEGGDSEK